MSDKQFRGRGNSEPRVSTPRIKAATSGSSRDRQFSMFEKDAHCVLRSLAEACVSMSLDMQDNGCNECSNLPLVVSFQVTIDLLLHDAID
jgi:hypothetical protein